MVNRDDINSDSIKSFKQNMFGSDFFFSVDRDFVRSLKTPAMLLHGKDKHHPEVISTELEELLHEGSVMLKDWERPDHGDVQRDTVIEFLSVNTP